MYLSGVETLFLRPYGYKFDLYIVYNVSVTAAPAPSPAPGNALSESAGAENARLEASLDSYTGVLLLGGSGRL